MADFTMSDIVKCGYIKRFSKSFLSGGWNQSFLELHRDSQLNVYKRQGDSKSQGSIFLKDVCKYFAYGQFTNGMPDRPELPSGASYDCIMGIPQKPSSKAKIHWFLFSSVNELNDWMAAICSTLPPPPQRVDPQQQQQQPVVSSAPPMSQAPPGNYGPPPPGPGLGFEGLALGGPAPPPYSPAPNQYRPPSPYPQGPHYSPQHQPYGQPAGTYGPPPQAPYPQQAYRPAPAQGYPQQQYYQQPGVAYPGQVHYPTPVQAGYQGYPQQGYPQQGYVQQQPIVIKQKSKKGFLGGNAGKMAAGLAGGALLGYGASRMIGGGWGVGRWGSWSSLSSCGSFGSVGSFGSFGSFD